MRERKEGAKNAGGHSGNSYVAEATPAAAAASSSNTEVVTSSLLMAMVE